jgi:hypothetical protein
MRYADACEILLVLAMAPALQGCFTKMLLKMGTPTPEDLPGRYDAAHRTGERLVLRWTSKKLEAGEVVHQLSKLPWDMITPGDPEPACTPRGWAALGSGGPAVPVPLVLDLTESLAQAIELHARKASGEPLVSVQLEGPDFWVLCGSREHLARAIMLLPEPHRSTGTIVAIVLLFPFALVADICGGFIGALAPR